MKRRFLSCFAVIAVALSLGACAGTGSSTESESAETVSASSAEESSAQEAVTTTILAMDTVMDITVYGDESLLTEAEELITAFEDKLSVTKEDSEIAKLNKEKSAVLSDDTKELLSYGLSYCEKTGGKLDLSIYPVVKAWGFTTGEYRVPDEDEITDLLQYVNYQNISLDGNNVTIGENMEIDLGSVAKGYTGDRVLSMFSENGVTSAILNLGGNVQTLGLKPDGSKWKVAITDPEDSSAYMGVISVENKAVITSGGYERYFEEDGVRYHHIIDPSTGHSANNGFTSVTIVGEKGVQCDAYSTALYVMGTDEAFDFWKEQGDFDAIFLTDDGTLYVTEGIADDFKPLGRFESSDVQVLTRD